MIDLVTVVRKELKELLGERASRRGVMVQSILALSMLGVLFPAQQPQAWVPGSPGAVLLFFIFPAFVAITIGADAFAGERERKTLETLLATPLPDRAVVFGKAIAALSAALVVAFGSLVAATITLNLTAHAGGLVIPSVELWVGALGATFASGLLGTALAVTLSMRIPVARSVQQMVSLGFLPPAFLLIWAFAKLGVPLNWHTIFCLQGIVAGLGAITLAAASAFFRRDRLFAKR
jgi:ABC-2 type transport system permease protein